MPNGALPLRNSNALSCTGGGDPPDPVVAGAGEPQRAVGPGGDDRRLAALGDRIDLERPVRSDPRDRAAVHQRHPHRAVGPCRQRVRPAVDGDLEDAAHASVTRPSSLSRGQQPVVRQHPNGVADRPGHRQRRRASRTPRCRRPDPVCVIGTVDRVHQRVAGVDPADDRLHHHLVGPQPGEVHRRGQRQLRAEQRGVGQPVAVDVGDPDLRPGVRARSQYAASSRAAPNGTPSTGLDGAVQRLRRRRVVLLGVVAHHPRGQHLGPEHLQRVPHHLHPAPRHAVLVAVVELRASPTSPAGRRARRPPGRRGGSRRRGRRRSGSPSRSRRRTTRPTSRRGSTGSARR